MNILENKRIDRRMFLKGSGVMLALPLLEAMRGTSLRGATQDAASPKRMVFVGNHLGMLPEKFFPKKAGVDYEMPELLEPLAEHKKSFTIFSNLDHDVTGGHKGVHAFLTGMRDSEASNWPERNISIDQRAAEHVGAQTRFPSIVASVGRGAGQLKCKMSWTRNGTNIPPVSKASALFDALFVQKNSKALKQENLDIDLDKSVLDAVMSHAKILERNLGKRDKEKLDEYFTSIREVEKQLGMTKKWLYEPKPKVSMKQPKDNGFVEDLPVFLDLITLALQTDSTRIATLEIPGSFNTRTMDLGKSYHSYSHHGKSLELQKGLYVIERFQMKQLARFFSKLKAIKEPSGESLFDRSMIMFGSGMGNGSSHSNKNLPVLLAGGHFKHGEHKIYPKESAKKVPLCNLYTTMLRAYDISIEKFNKGTGTLTNFA